MKSKKAILFLILAAVIVVLTEIFKENLPRALIYISYVSGIVFASIAVHLEKNNS